MLARIRGPRTYRTDRHYRSRIEILRDFLGAVRETGKKTHIIGLANLNPASFQPYLEFCRTLQLVQNTPTGYRLTPRADAVLQVIERLLARSAEVDAALLDLYRGFNNGHVPESPPKGALRYVSILAWNEVVRSAKQSLVPEIEARRDLRPLDLSSTAMSAWFDRVGTSEPEGSEVALHILPVEDTATPRRPPRTRSRERPPR